MGWRFRLAGEHRSRRARRRVAAARKVPGGREDPRLLVRRVAGEHRSRRARRRVAAARKVPGGREDPRLLVRRVNMFNG